MTHQNNHKNSFREDDDLITDALRRAYVDDADTDEGEADDRFSALLSKIDRALRKTA